MRKLRYQRVSACWALTNSNWNLSPGLLNPRSYNLPLQSPLPAWGFGRKRKKPSRTTQSGIFLASVAVHLSRQAGAGRPGNEGGACPVVSRFPQGREVSSAPHAQLFLPVDSGVDSDLNKADNVKSIPVWLWSEYMLLLLFLVFNFIYLFFCSSINCRANTNYVLLTDMKWKWVVLLQVYILYGMGSWDDDTVCQMGQ